MSNTIKGHQRGIGRRVQRSWLRGMLAAVVALCFVPTSAFAWWNHDWSFRKQITVDAGAKGADTKSDLGNVTVLVRLHDGVLKFTDANADGSDLRFVADDDKTPLKFHIEKFDSVFNLGFVWVKLPALKAGAQTKIWMYYGNPKTVAASEPRESWDASQTLVYHLDQRGAPAADATANGNNGGVLSKVDDGSLIGTGAKFEGTEVITVPASPSLMVAAGSALTASMWIKPTAAKADAVLYARHDDKASLILGLAAGVPYAAVTDTSGQSIRVAATQALGEKGWHQVAFTAAAGNLVLYVDGKQAATAAGALPALNAPATLGGDGETARYSGGMDEFRLAKVARDPQWLALSALNQGENDTSVNFGNDEQLSSWSSGYVGVILHSVTLDGWVVIGVLMVMALISWTVMALKGVQISRISGANRSFLDLYKAVAGDFDALNHLASGSAEAAGIDVDEEDRERMQESPLLHVFKSGLDELRDRLNRDKGRRGGYLTPQSIEAIRASLDSSLIKETQSLNRLMVLLTIAISGGPFIGLLGTVVGVMITFAAIAASGDVNVNSIAPGIAAALVATVAGLMVAIPALFGYNYLLTRIKEITAEMHVFLDAFITRMAENYDSPQLLTGDE